MIVIIDYDAGNIRSVQNALQRLNAEAVLSNNIDEILAADRVILPGVGSAGRAMDSLRHKKLDKIIPGLKQPVLKILVWEGRKIINLKVLRIKNSIQGFLSELKSILSGLSRPPHLPYKAKIKIII